MIIEDLKEKQDFTEFDKWLEELAEKNGTTDYWV